MRPKTMLILALAVILALPAAAASPALVSYQTRLEDGSGTPIADLTELAFRIYTGGDNMTGGTLVYHEVATVDPSDDGIFTHLIGSGTPEQDCTPESPADCTLTPDDFPTDGTPVWLELTVDPTTMPDKLLPRTRFATVGYAMQADSLDGRDSSEFIDTTATPQNKAGTLTVGDLSCSSCIGSGDIGVGAVNTSHVAANTLTADDLGPDSVTASEIAPNSVQNSELAGGAVSTIKLANDAVTKEKIAPGTFVTMMGRCSIPSGSTNTTICDPGVTHTAAAGQRAVVMSSFGVATTTAELQATRIFYSTDGGANWNDCDAFGQYYNYGAGETVTVANGIASNCTMDLTSGSTYRWGIRFAGGTTTGTSYGTVTVMILPD